MMPIPAVAVMRLPLAVSTPPTPRGRLDIGDRDADVVEYRPHNRVSLTFRINAPEWHRTAPSSRAAPPPCRGRALAGRFDRRPPRARPSPRRGARGTPKTAPRRARAADTRRGRDAAPTAARFRVP